MRAQTVCSMVSDRIYLNGHFSLSSFVTVICVLVFYSFKLSKYFEVKEQTKGLSCKCWYVHSIGFWLYLNGIKLNKNFMITTIMTILLLTTIIAANIYLVHTYVPGTMLGTLHGILLNPHSHLMRYRYISSTLFIRKTEPQSCLIVCPQLVSENLNPGSCLWSPCF